MTFQPFEVVVLPFPYSDKLAEQRRPSLVISQPEMEMATGQLWVAMITTSRRERFGDAPITDLVSAGLPLTSRLRASKIATVEVDRVVRQLGELAEPDRTAAVAAFRGCATF